MRLNLTQHGERYQVRTIQGLTDCELFLDLSDGGAWPFLVGGVICLVDSDNERDLCLTIVHSLAWGRWGNTGAVATYLLPLRDPIATRFPFGGGGVNPESAVSPPFLLQKGVCICVFGKSCSLCVVEQRLRGVLPPCGEAGFFNGATCVSYHEACVRWSQQQVCDALKCPGQHAHYTGVVNKSPCRGVGKEGGGGKGLGEGKSLSPSRFASLRFSPLCDVCILPRSGVREIWWNPIRDWDR